MTSQRKLEYAHAWLHSEFVADSAFGQQGIGLLDGLKIIECCYQPALSILGENQ